MLKQIAHLDFFNFTFEFKLHVNWDGLQLFFPSSNLKIIGSWKVLMKFCG